MGLVKTRRLAAMQKQQRAKAQMKPKPPKTDSPKQPSSGKRAKPFVAVAVLAATMLAKCILAAMPEGFVPVGEAVPDAILEIRYYSTYNFTGERIDGYEEPVAILTKEAAQALKAASDDAMRRGYRLKIYDAYRPQRAIAHFMRWAKDLSDVRMKACFYPNLDKSVLFAQGYIAEKSGHSRGSTVDLTLFDMASGKELDMGGTFDFFGEESHPDWRGVTEAQFANRMTLRAIMTAHGFKPLAEEWWHFTLSKEPYPDTYFDFPVAQAENPCPSSIFRKEGIKNDRTRKT